MLQKVVEQVQIGKDVKEKFERVLKEYSFAAFNTN